MFSVLCLTFMPLSELGWCHMLSPGNRRLMIMTCLVTEDSRVLGSDSHTDRQAVVLMRFCL